MNFMNNLVRKVMKVKVKMRMMMVKKDRQKKR
jgi:hypothetical protein